MPKKPLKVFICALCLLAACLGSGGASDIQITGTIRSNIISDPSLHIPEQEEVFPWIGRLYGGTASVWSNRFELMVTGGKPNDNVYFRLPLNLGFAEFEEPSSKSLTYRFGLGTTETSFPILSIRKGNEYQATIAQNIMFKPMGILGNFKKYGASSRYDGHWGFNLTGSLGPARDYVLDIFQTRRWKTIRPITFYHDTIPEQVAKLRTGARGDGFEVGEFQGAWESYPTYITFGFQGGEPLLGEDVFGIFFGSKYMLDPNFMLDEKSTSTHRVASYNGKEARLAYRKDAVEVNWMRQLYRGNLTLAASLSQGNWWVELTEGGRVDLGTVGGSAFSAEFSDVAIGPFAFNGRYLQVGPDYQWVLAQSAEMTYNQSAGYRIPEEEPLFTEQQNQAALSDVSQYLGMCRLNLSLSTPGTFLGMPATIQASYLGNIWKDVRRRVVDWDRKWGLVTNKDFQQIDIDLEATKLLDFFTLSLLKRNYLPMHREHVPDSLQAARLNWIRAIGSNSWTNQWELRHRERWDSPNRDGYGYRFTSYFNGRFPNRVRLKLGIDLRQGTYDFGHIVVTNGDRILASPYRYFQGDVKYQQSKTLQLGGLNINCSLGSHLWLLQTDLPGVPSGFSSIGYGKATIPWFNNALNQSISLIVASGPKEIDFPTGYVIPAVDSTLRYNFSGSKTTSLILRTTQFFGDEHTAPLLVTSARFRILVGSGSFSIYYGYWDWERLWPGDIDRYITQRIHPLTGETWDEWNYWYVSKLWKSFRNIQYTNHFRLEYALRF